jgi:hypothetical protein
MSSENPSGADNQQERPNLGSCEQLGILRGHTQSSSFAAGMKIWSMPHSDMGEHRTITVLRLQKNLSSRREVLPLPAATLVSVAGYMLENPEHPSGTRHAIDMAVTIQWRAA